MPTRPRPLLGLVVCLSAVLAGCTTAGPEPAPTLTATAQAPSAATTVLAAPGGPELAVEASRAFFDQAPVVAMAPAADATAGLAAASLGVALGIPVLLAADGEDSAAVAEELERLGTVTVLGFGDVGPLLAPASAQETAAPEDAGTPQVEVVRVEGDDSQVGALLGLELGAAEQVAPGGEVAALAALDPAAARVLRLEGAPAPTPAPTSTGDEAAPVVPVIAETERVAGVTALSDGSAVQAAAVGTARAAGARVLVVPGGDPRGSSEAIAALAAAEPSAVVAFGAGFGDDETLAWRVATAATGVELPGGTQLVFEGKRLVALYGTPGSSALGVLGEQGIPETIARARQHAQAMQPYTEDTVVPSLEIIASIASAGAGPDGDYSATRPVAELKPLVDAAGEAGLYVVLDLQPGRTDFLTQARMYEELLQLPHVGLALDPEWRLKPNQRHLRQIGSVGIDEVNQVVTYLADLTRKNRLPQKLLVLHQFRLSMIVDRDRLDTSRSELALMIHVDGQGTQPAKNDTWRALRNGAPEVYWGWKNFYDEDVPMLGPEQTMRIDPVPHLVSYQ